MILSFHPCFVGDSNILCAGREPDENDRRAVQSADAVILPQGCSPALYRMARDGCGHVFPNYDKKYAYPDKIGQIRLFREVGAAHPDSELYPTLKDFFNHYGQIIEKPSVGFPFIFKFNWGGEGENVFLIRTLAEFRNAVQKASEYEKTGQKGFIVQKYVPNGDRSLRVVVMGKRFFTYWRVQMDPNHFCSNVARGGIIDSVSDPELQKIGEAAVADFCRETGINLAGIDLLFSSKDDSSNPLFLEINYYFGRQGLGGSLKYYDLLVEEILHWLDDIGLDFPETYRVSE